MENNWYHAAIAGQSGMVETEARQSIDTLIRSPIVAEWLTIGGQLFSATYSFLFPWESRKDRHKMISGMLQTDWHLETTITEYCAVDWVIQPLSFWKYAFFFLSERRTGEMSEVCPCDLPLSPPIIPTLMYKDIPWLHFTSNAHFTLCAQITEHLDARISGNLRRLSQRLPELPARNTRSFISNRCWIAIIQLHSEAAVCHPFL